MIYPSEKTRKKPILGNNFGGGAGCTPGSLDAKERWALVSLRAGQRMGFLIFPSSQAQTSIMSPDALPPFLL